MTAVSTNSAGAADRQRDYAQDIAKGLGILLVAQVHIFNYPDWYRIIMAITGVWLMSFFFTVSGYYYRPGARKPSESIRRRAVQLMKPYFIYSICIWVITTAYNLINEACSLWDCVKQYLSFLVSRNSLILVGVADKQAPMPQVENGISFMSVTVPFWFIAMMFLADIVFFLIADWALSNMKRFISVTSGLVLVSFGLNIVTDAIGFGLPWNAQNVPMATALMLVGAMFGRYGVLSKGYTSRKWMIINSLVTAAVIAVIQFQFNGAGSFAAGRFMFFGAVEIFPCVLFGIMAPFMAVCFGRLLEKIPLLGRALVWMGYRTLPMLLAHMVISSLIGVFTGIDRKPAEAGESALNLALTVAVFVIWRIVWEFILKKIRAKKEK